MLTQLEGWNNTRSPAKKVYSQNRGWIKVKHEQSDCEAETVWNVALINVSGSQKHHSLGFRHGEMAELCHGHACANTLLDKLFLFGLHLGNRKNPLTLLPNWTYSNVLHSKVRGGVFRQLVSCHQDYNACTAHLITADNNSQREYFYKIAWQYVRDRVNLPVLPEERSILQEPAEKSSI